VDHRDTFLSILEGLRDFSSSCPIVFPAHPRTLKSIGDLGLAEFFEFGNGDQEQKDLRPISATRRIRLVDPLGYLDFLCLMKHASLVVTDSGGIQEETTCLGVPCVTVRDNTERPATVTRGTNVIAGTKTESIRNAILQQTSSLRSAGGVPEKWDGRAGVRILEAVALELRERSLVSAF
jgi:UDP-N-acetylglucosamine 2-epimerase (non-hydrolysing)